LPDLPGATAEARAVADIISTAGYQVTEAPPSSEGIDVVNRLYEKPYRILHVSAHGVYRAGQGKNRRTGVVLSNGLLLTAAEIAALEVVPDLVFLNCCFTGRLDAIPQTPYNRLAYSVARELIESGVRTVIAAGWAVTMKRHVTLQSASIRASCATGGLLA
jgi:CHAT domain-containing protein